MFIKKLVQLAFCSAVAGCPVYAHAAKIAVSMSSFDDNFLTLLRNGMKNYATTQKDVSVQFEDAQKDVGRQISQVQNFIAQRVDVIVVNLVDTDVSPKITRLAAAAKIPLVYVNLQPSEKALPQGVAFVGTREADAGSMQMQEVCRLLGGKGNVVILMGDLAHQAARERTRSNEAVTATPACRNIHVVEKQSARWGRTEGRDLVMNWLSAGVKFDAVLANNDEMALGAAQALKSANKLKTTVVAGIDATHDALNAMKAGELRVTVFQDAAGEGRGAIEVALKLVARQPVNANNYLPFKLVTPANMKQFEGLN